MGKPPAYLFVVRHGTRLDAADKQWHLTSPTPYDPPLTYGGWLQSRALGARIGTILRERLEADEKEEAVFAARQANKVGPGQSNKRKRKRRKFQVVIHSSPFLRCIQTSIGISAGIASHEGMPSSDKPAFTRSAEALPSTSLNKPDTSGPGRPQQELLPTPTAHLRKTVLRLDAFLGEWLSPSYFDHITPPPGSVMMVAGAKAGLLKKEDHSDYPGFASHVHASSHSQLPSPRIVVSNPLAAPTMTSSARNSADDVNHISGSLVRHGSMRNVTSDPSLAPAALTSAGYVAPVPSYAISSSTSIPMGYVSHAKDATVEVDYQWDSMRGPLEWGDGGSYGEEWTSMHQRFKRGIQRMIDWYSIAEHPAERLSRPKSATRTSNGSSDSAIEFEEDDEEDAEPVVIIVSHGAGCNALIGAITHQPVLTDVAMASVTMAVRKSCEDIVISDRPPSSSSEASAAGASWHTGIIPGEEGHVRLHQHYEVKLFADTEHLRSTPAVSRSQSVAASIQARGRPASSLLATHNHYAGYYDPAGSRSSSANAIMGLTTAGRRGSNNGPAPHRSPLITSQPRTSGGYFPGSSGGTFSARPGTGSPSGLSRTPSMGLWSPVPKYEEQSILDDDDDDDYIQSDGLSRYGANNGRQVGIGASLPSPALSPVLAAAQASKGAQSGSEPIAIPDFIIKAASGPSLASPAEGTGGLGTHGPGSSKPRATSLSTTRDSTVLPSGVFTAQADAEERGPEGFRLHEAPVQSHSDMQAQRLTKGAGPGGLWGSQTTPRSSMDDDRHADLPGPSQPYAADARSAASQMPAMEGERSAVGRPLGDVSGMKRRWTVNERA
jgi:hypothetical protein